MLSTKESVCGLVGYTEVNSFMRWSHLGTSYGTLGHRSVLTNWGRDKIAAIFLTTFSNAFSLIKKVPISFKISLMFVLRGPINNIPALVQIMTWLRPGDKSLSEPVMVSLLTHICVTRPQWLTKTEQLLIHMQNRTWFSNILALCIHSNNVLQNC